MTKFDDFLEWLEANPWIVLWVGVLALCGFFRGLYDWKVPFTLSVGRRSSGFCCGGGAGGGISVVVLPLLAVCVDCAYRFTIRNDYFYVYKTLKKGGL